MKQLIFVCILVCLARLSTGVAIKSDTLSSSSSSLQLEKNKKDTQEPTRQLLQGNECAPGSSWKGRCDNQCSCTSQGHPLCTRVGCLEQTESSPRCAPGTVWKRDCNICRCTSRGFPLCTLIECRVPTDLTNDSATDSPSYKEALPASLQSHENQSKAVVCIANRIFIRDCNTCWCNEDGTGFYCTRKLCVPELPDEGETGSGDEKLRVIKRECKPDEVFQWECNSCRCNTDGKSFSCTRRTCADATDEDGKLQNQKNTKLSRSVRTIQSQTSPKNCKPGSEFRVDCNDCLCDNKGQEFSCTRFDCSKSKNGHGELRVKRDTSTKLTLEQVTTECVPESVFDQGCSVCRCLEDGHHAACSLKRCNQQGQDTSAENDINSSGVDSFRCDPGVQFKRDCNDCTCSADGKSVFCTLRLCDKDLAPTE